MLVVVFLPLLETQAQFKKLKNKLNKITNDPAAFIKDQATSKLDEARSEFDSSSFNYAVALSDNATLFESKEKGAKLGNVSRRLIGSEEEKTPLEVANDYLDAGELLYATGRYKGAEVSFITAKLSYEEEQLTDHINYGRVLANMGLLYHTTGRYTKAEQYTLTALEFREENLGKEHAAYGASLNNLGVLSKDLGRYNQSEKELAEALEIINQAQGKEVMPFAIALNNQAKLFQSMGRYESAVSLMEQAIQISASVGSEKSTNHQRLLNNQALLYQDMGEYQKAEEIFLHVISLKEKRFGKKHPDYAHMLNNLASLYLEMGKDEQVEDLLKRARAIYEDKFGQKHPSFASTVNNLGNFYRYKGRLEEAKVELQTAHSIRAEILGPDHPDYVESEEDLAILFWEIGDYSKAIGMYEVILDRSLQFIDKYFAPMSESEKTKYWDKLRPRFQRFYSLVLVASADHPSAVGKMYNYQLRTKALLLNATNKIKSQILSSGDYQLIEEYLVWLDQKESLSRYYSYSKAELAEEKINIDSLENAANAKEKWLSEKSKIFDEGYQSEQISFKDIAGSLTASEAAVEIVQVEKFKNGFTGEINYAAIVLKGGTTSPELVVIENGAQLEGRYYKYYKNAIKQKLKDEYSYDQYWKSIEAALEGSEQLYVSLDGIYNQINLNTLADANGKFVIEKNGIVLLSNTKDLPSFKANTGAVSFSKATLVGFPEYGNDDEVLPLPGTKREVEIISKTISTSVDAQSFIGQEATETNVKSIRQPEVLHIATHGFFLEDVSNKSDKVFGVEPDRAQENPLLRSGLLLTGAGNTISGINTTEAIPGDNGVLTAYEAMNMDLHETKMVVLSACETGLGDIKSGEGVYGLQRSFLVAGSEAVIMSLWKVSDEATQQLMTNFYSNLSKGGDLQTSFEKAQLALKTKYPDPYYWGAFVLVRS